jgi:flagellar biosynthetic protein FliP
MPQSSLAPELSVERSFRRLVVAIVVAVVLLAVGGALVVAGRAPKHDVQPTRHDDLRGTVVVAGLTAARPVAVSRPADVTAPTPPTAPAPPTPPTPTAGSDSGNGKGSITIDLGNLTGNSGTNKNGTSTKPGQSVVIILLLSLLAVAPALILMLTSFTRIVIVLSLTRNALGLQTVPPNQVVIGLALFLSLFVMFPTISAMNKDALQPFLKGEITQKVAYDKATAPLKTFMLKQTHKSELNLFINASKEKKPATPKDVSMATLVPAFVLSELKTAFIIGFVIFIPFLVIDLVVSSSLMSMGMFMLPPVLVSLPFKLLLFVMVDGWALIVKSLITSFH